MPGALDELCPVKSATVIGCLAAGLVSASGLAGADFVESCAGGWAAGATSLTPVPVGAAATTGAAGGGALLVATRLEVSVGNSMLPFFGRCHIGYIPSGRVFGVSKLARLVDMYARRLQLQERLTEQISKEVMESVDAKGVGVMIEARHLCMMMRGVEKQNSVMVTSSVLGAFRESQATREEFLALIGQRAV